MTNGNHKSLGFILWRVLKNPLCQDLTYEEAAEYALEYIRLLGAPMAYIDKTEPLQLKMYKAELPCDILNIRGVRYSNCTFPTGDAIAMRYASNIYHTNNDEFSNFDGYRDGIIGEYTYIVQKGIIITSKCDGYVEISYKGIALDEDGYPLVPDDEKVVLGMEYYIMHRYLEPLWMMGKITDKVFEYIQQKRYWYAGAADASLRSINPDQMETIVNGINRLIVNTTAHQNFYKNLGQKEYIKRYF